MAHTLSRREEFFRADDVVVLRMERIAPIFFKMPAINFLQRIYKNPAYFGNNQKYYELVA